MQTALMEIALVVFTALAPAGALAYMALALACVFGPAAFDSRKVQRHLVIPLMVAIVALVAAATHLGTPANALYVMNGVGRSPLSNEVISVAVFLAIGGWTWIVSFSNKPIDGLLRVGCALAAIAALVSVHFISMAYAVDTIPTWNAKYVPMTMWLGGLSAASPLVLVSIAFARIVPSNAVVRACLVLTAAAAVANAVLLMIGLSGFEAIHTTVNNAAELARWSKPGALVYLILEGCAVVGIVIAIEPMRHVASTNRSHRLAVALLGASCICVFAANFVMRFAFYSTYMTVGL